MNLLDEIVQNKRKEIEEKRRLNSIDKLIRNATLEHRDFKTAIKKGHVALIAEIKRISPSAGMILENFNPSSIARIYESAKVDALSFVSDKKYFGGNVEIIKEIKKASSLPILRKDFIIDEYQIYEAYHYGADALLLIARILPITKLKRFVKIAKSFGLETVLECHTKRDIDKALETDTEIIGINNRDLDTFTIDLNRSLRLKSLIPDDYITISESGINTVADVRTLRDAGFDAILVGTSLLKAKDISKKINELKGAGG
ncbi:MAG: indole-3-glycerol phosphate synthase TrpC [candidate division WOR-3 bacterium]